MPGHRRYTKSEKAAAVGLAVVEGQRDAAERLGIPQTTINYWMHHPEFVELRSKSRDEVADQLWAAIQMGVAEVARGLSDPQAALRDKVVALGILYDKHALLTGSATARTEARDITGTISDAELVAIVREADRIASEERAAIAAADAPA